MLNQKINYWLVLALVFLSVFLFIKIAGAVAPGEVVINEIAWMGTASSSADEWIEIYNKSASAVDLTGWQMKAKDGTPSIDLAGQIEPGGYFLLERTDDNSAPGVAADQIYSGDLSNSGEELRLLDSNQVVIDEVLAGSGWSAGDNTTKLTMERKIDLSWGNSLMAGGTPKALNGSPGDQQDKEEPTTYSTDSVINELMPNPSESDDYEWIELYNNGATVVDLANWQIADNSKVFIINATGTFTTIIEARGFLVIPKVVSGISLNNTGGEGVTLKNPDGVMVSQTSYSESALDDYVWAREEGGDYKWSTTATEGQKNIITAPVENIGGSSGGGGSGGTSQTEEKKSAGSSFKDKIIITEIMPNPFGIDGGKNEWIEIYNTSTEPVILDDWKIKDNFSFYIFKNKRVEPKNFLVLGREETGLVLNNEGGEALELIDKNGGLVAKASYKVKAPEGLSFGWCGRSFEWLDTPTEGAENKCPVENDKPAAYFEVNKYQVVLGEMIMMDAEESYDTDGKIIKYIWEFSDEVMASQEKNKIFETNAPIIGIRFLKTGINKVTLKVVDDLGGEDIFKQEIEVQPDKNKPDYENIFINELMPNPKGLDSGNEWIELYNNGSGEVDLIGCSLAMNKGKTYKITNLVLPAKGYAVLSDKITKIVLLNSEGDLKLIDPEGKTIREINYSKVLEGWSYARDEEKGNSWEWTNKPTLKEKNIIAGQVVGSKAVRTSSAGDGQAIRIVGKVIVEPGLLGKNIFYIQEEGGRGAQIYSYYKDFPNLAMGDKVEVVGVVGDYQGERRIKTKSRNDIKVLSNGEMVAPTEVQVEDVGEDNEGAMVKITGQLTEIKGASWWLDDGTGELKVYLKQNANINKGQIEVGDTLEVSGVVSQYQDEYRLLPRYPEDIKVVGKVLGAETEGDKTEKENSDILKYLLAVAVAVILVLITYIKKNSGSKKNF